MLYTLKKILGLTDALFDASQSGDPNKFARVFGYSTIFCLSTPISDSLDPSSMSQEELMRLIKDAAEAMSKQNAVTPFSYAEDSVRVLPIFTSEAAAGIFVGEYLKAIDRVIPFQVFSVTGNQLVSQLDCAQRVVLNPKCNSEYALSKEDVEQVRKLWNV